MTSETITASPSAGYCIVDGEVLLQRHLEGGLIQIDASAERPSLSLVSDWKVYTAESVTSAAELANKEGKTDWCRTLADSCTKITDQDTRLYLFGEIEKLLASVVSGRVVISRMLIAPFKDRDCLFDLSALAVSQGYAVAGDLFSRLFDLQPLIGRLSAIWLNLPKEAFFGLDVSKEKLWSSFANSGEMITILETVSESGLKDLFGKIAFAQSSPSVRAAVARIGNLLSEEIYGRSEVDYAALAAETHSSQKKNKSKRVPKRSNSFKELNRALSEIDAITEALSTGKDYLADRFIRDLVTRQIADSEKSDYAVKSLCNIGQRCAEMFRTDFEWRCLESATTINASDGWLQVQVADHLKRTGQYSQAIDAASRAIDGSEYEVARSLLADIHSQMGKYEEAIAIYKQISGWEQDGRVLVGIADNYRRLGESGEAESLYSAALSMEENNDRALAGIAELAKGEGRLADAVQIYEGILNLPGLDSPTKWFYTLVLAEYRRSLGDLEGAYVLTEAILEEAPFFMRARVLRASLLGLMGNAEDALASLPEGRGTAALGEWVEAYTRGLLLLLTRNYADARSELVESLNNSVLREDEAAIIRLASALSSISTNDTESARMYLDAQSQYSDARTRYLSQVFRYHIAIIENDSGLAKVLRQSLAALPDSDQAFAGIVNLLDENKIEEAINLEATVMLRIAA